MGSGEIVVMIEKQRFQISVVKHHLWIGPWWWPSGQRAHLLLRRSEFESHWGLQFFCKIVIEKNENKQKEARVGQFFKKTLLMKTCIVCAETMLDHGRTSNKCTCHPFHNHEVVGSNRVQSIESYSTTCKNIRQISRNLSHHKFSFFPLSRSLSPLSITTLFKVIAIQEWTDGTQNCTPP